MSTPAKTGLVLLWTAANISMLPAQSAGAFTPTGSMITPRAGHTATLLLNGKVLIAGGWSGDYSQRLASAEIYDPRTRTFSPTGDMTKPRAGHSATLLPNGHVLIVGLNPPRVEAEIYDPLTGKFSPAGSTDDERVICAGVTMLSTGKLLINVGTWWPPAGLQGVPPYLYDPANGNFEITGKYATTDNLDEGVCPTDVMLANGKVLTTWESWKAEVYNPDTGTYSPTGDLVNTGSEGYTATLLTNGNVLIAGGDTNPINSLYDPATGKFTATGNMKSTRNGHSATLLSDETVLLTGGWNYPFTPTVAELYHPDSGAFTATGAMMTPRMGHTATLLPDGSVLIAGGTSAFALPAAALDSAETYHPVQTRPAAVLLSAWDGAAAILHASTHQIVSQNTPASEGEAIEIYMTGLIDDSIIPPQVSIGGRVAEVLWFGNAPGYSGLNQINVRVPSGVTAGAAVPVHLIYLGRPSNGVSIALR